MKTKVDVVIIGGGIAGCSVAFHLAQKGVSDVVLFERSNGLGNWETARSAAMLMHQTGIKAVSLLAKQSIEEYESYTAEFGASLGFHKVGSILYTTSSVGKQEIERRLLMQKELGIDSTPLTPNQIRNLVPMVNTDDIVGGIYCSQDGYLSQNEVVQFYFHKAQEKGVEFYRNIEAWPRAKEDRVLGVEIGKNVIETKYIVNAAGGMAHLVGKALGIRIPITNNVRSLADLQPAQTVQSFPILEDIDSEWYFRPEVGGLILFGVGPTTPYELDESNKDTYPQKDARVEEEVANYVSHRTPKLTEAGFVTSWPGIRSLSPDGLPILGKVNEVEGYINCCALSGFGITTAPACGKLIAELIVHGTTSVPLDPFLLSRFHKVGP